MKTDTNETYVTVEAMNNAMRDLQLYLEVKHMRDKQLDIIDRLEAYKDYAWTGAVVCVGVEIAVLATWIVALVNGGNAAELAFATAFVFWIAAAVTVLYVVLRNRLERKDAAFLSWAKANLKGTDLWCDEFDDNFVDANTEN